MISAHDEKRLRELADEKWPKDVAPMPERLADALPRYSFTINPSEDQKRLWAAQMAERERKLKIKPKFDILRDDCGGRRSRLDPWHTTIESFEVYEDAQRAVIDLAKEYIADIPRHRREGNGVFLIGAPGTGKDHLAVAIAREFIRLDMTARRFFCPEMRATLRDSFKNSGQRETGIIQPAVTPDVIILSDPVTLGSKLTDSQADMFFKIVEARNIARKPTIVTANFESEAEAKDKLGSQVVDRLSQGGLRLFCNWESYRTRGRK